MKNVSIFRPFSTSTFTFKSKIYSVWGPFETVELDRQRTFTRKYEVSFEIYSCRSSSRKSSRTIFTENIQAKFVHKNITHDLLTKNHQAGSIKKSLGNVYYKKSDGKICLEKTLQAGFIKKVSWKCLSQKMCGQNLFRKNSPGRTSCSIR